jgi:TIR domain
MAIKESAFLDVDAIPLGTNFAKVLHEEVVKCGVLLAVIGPNWPDARDEEGNRRLDDPTDFVRIEIAAALQRDIPVIPILLDGARIPKANQLPEALKELSSRNGLDVRHASFHDDIERLISGLQDKLGQAGGPEGVDLREGGVSEVLTKNSVRGAPTHLSSVIRQYAKEIHDQLGYLPTWLPTAPVKVGDVGTVEQGIFTIMGTLSDFGIAFTDQVHPEKADPGQAGLKAPLTARIRAVFTVGCMASKGDTGAAGVYHRGCNQPGCITSGMSFDGWPTTRAAERPAAPAC